MKTRFHDKDAYEKVKEGTRKHQKMGFNEYQEWINSSFTSEQAIVLKELSPNTYIGKTPNIK